MRFLLLIIYLFTQICFAAPLNDTEKTICDYLVNAKQAQIDLLEKIVNVNSGTNNIQGVYAVGNILRPEFEKLGFQTTWVKEPAEMNRAATLIAQHKGNKGKRILLIGHLDTVFPKDSPFQQFQLNNDTKETAKGPGVIDDKGGVIVILFALKALDAAQVLKDATITVVLTGDEEDSGKPTSLSRKPLLEAAENMDAALDFEPTASLDTATIARRGVSHFRIETKGNQAHSAAIFKKEVGDGAIFELARILNDMRTKLSGEKELSFNPGLVAGGTTVGNDPSLTSAKAFGKQNVIAKSAIAEGDFRFLTLAQKDSFEKKVTEIVNQHLPETRADVSFQDGIPAMQPTEENLDLLIKYSEVSNDLGYGKVLPLDANLRGAGDISHVASIVHANVAGLGALGFGAHTTEETIDLHSLIPQTERAAILIYRLVCNR